MVKEPDWNKLLGWGKQQVNDLRLLAYSYVRQGVYDVALTVFDALAVLDPSSSYDLQSIGAIHLQQGNGLDALEFLDRALELDPQHLPTRLNRVKALFMIGSMEEGLVEAKKLTSSIDPEIAGQAAALLLAYRD